MIKNILWDVDGTIFDTYPAFVRALGAALAEFGVQVRDDRIAGLARVSLLKCTRVLSVEYGLDQDRLYLVFQRMYATIPASEQPPYEAVRGICAKIIARGGHNLIVTHREKRTLDMLLDAHDMTALFSDSLTADDGLPRKPDAAMFETTITRFRLVRSETLVVGDRDLDIQAGKAARLRTCLFGFSPGQMKADITVGDYAELHHWLLAGDSLLAT